MGFWPVHSFTCSPLTKIQGEMLSYGKGGSEAEASICGTEMKAPSEWNSPGTQQALPSAFTGLGDANPVLLQQDSVLPK